MPEANAAPPLGDGGEQYISVGGKDPPDVITNRFFRTARIRAGPTLGDGRSRGSVLTRPLFEHLAEVAGEIGAARHLLLGLDFDGTLAPIVSHPEGAVMPEPTRSILRRLAARPDMTVAIVSGRAMPDLARRMDLDVILA